MIKLLISLSLVAAVYCGPLNAALDGIPEGIKADTGSVDMDQPQADWNSNYRALKLKYEMLKQIQQEVGAMNLGSKGNTNTQREVGFNSKGQSTYLQRERGTYGSKGQSRGDQLEVAEPAQDCESEKEELQVMKVSNDMLRTQKEKAKRDTRRASSENSRLTAVNQHLYAEKGQLEQTVQNLEGQNENLMTENTHLRAERANLENQVEHQQGEISNLNTQVANLNGEIANLKGELNACKSRQTELEAELEEKNREIANLNAQIEQLNQEINTLTARVNELEAQVASLEEANQELTAELATTREELANCNEEVNDMKAEMDNLKAEVANLQGAVTKLTTENMELFKEKSELETYAAQLLVQKEACEAKPCPDGYSLYGNKCYKYVSKKRQWKSAQEYCMNDKANLVSITNKDEQTNLVQYLKEEKSVRDHYVYTGGEELRGQWQWENTRSGFGDYQNWYHGKPVQGERDQCLTLYMHHPKKVGKWLEMNCDLGFSFVCSQDPNTKSLDAMMKETESLLGLALENMGMTGNNPGHAHAKSIYVMMGDKNKH